MARRSTNTSVSLFPFLAVLVCTMGALILLLLVTTRRIRQQQQSQVVAAEAEAADAAKPVTIEADDASDNTDPIPLPSIASEPEVDKAKAKRNQQRVAQLQSELDDLQRQRTAGLIHLNTVTDQLREANFRLSTTVIAESQSSKAMSENRENLRRLRTQETTLERRLLQLTEQIASLENELQQTEQSAADVTALVAHREAGLISLRQLVQSRTEQADQGADETLIEFSGATGTSRVPILIDVSEDGYVFQPSDVRITLKDLVGFPANNNPLLAGVLALHRERSDLSSDPYVLLLVRPGGSMGFYAAQRSLQSAGVHYGYELLESDKKIAFGTPAEAETRVLRESLLTSLAQRSRLFAQLNRAVSPEAPDDSVEGQRKITIGADGRISVTQNSPDPSSVDGRYYAGGQVPNFGQNPRYRPPTPSRAKNQESSADTQSDAGQPLDRVPEDASEPVIASTAKVAFPESTKSESPTGSSADDEVAELVDNSPPSATDTDNSSTPETVRSETVRSETTEDVSNTVAEFWANLSPFEPPDSPSNPDRIPDGGAPSLPSDRPDASEPDERRASRTVGPAGSTSAAVPPFEFGPAPFSNPPVNEQPSSRNSAALQPAPNPGLLAQLQRTSQMPPQFVSGVEVTVFVDAEYMTIASQDPVYIGDASTDQIYAALLVGVNEEIQDAPRFADGTVLPVVRFVVSPGAEPTHVRMSNRLKTIGVPNSSRVRLTPHLNETWEYETDERAHPPEKHLSIPVMRQEEAKDRRVRT